MTVFFFFFYRSCNFVEHSWIPSIFIWVIMKYFTMVYLNDEFETLPLHCLLFVFSKKENSWLFSDIVRNIFTYCKFLQKLYFLCYCCWYYWYYIKIVWKICLNKILNRGISNYRKGKANSAFRLLTLETRKLVADMQLVI